MRNALDQRGRVLARKVQHPRVRLARVDHDPQGLFRRHVPQYALREAQVLVEQRRRGDVPRARVEVVPELGQILDVALHLALGGGLRHRAYDEAAGVAVGQEQLQLAAQDFALGLVPDPLGDADVRVLRQVDEQSSGKADLRRKAGALGADRVLDHLHEQRLPLVQDLLDRTRVAAAVPVLPMLPDVGDVQERRPLEADLDERALHPGEHSRDTAETDVADETPRARALDVEFLHDALLEHRDAGFLRGYVDKDFMRHRLARRFKVESAAAGALRWRRTARLSGTLIARGSRWRRAPGPSRTAADP